MKVVPITSLKPASKAIVEQIVGGSEGEINAKNIMRLRELGFHPGKEVSLQNKNSSCYIIKVGTSSSYALGKDLASKITPKTMMSKKSTFIISTQIERSCFFAPVFPRHFILKGCCSDQTRI